MAAAARVTTFVVNFDNTYPLDSINELFNESEKMAGKIGIFESWHGQPKMPSLREMEEICNAIIEWPAIETPEKLSNRETNPDSWPNFDNHQGNMNQQLPQNVLNANSIYPDEVIACPEKRRKQEYDETPDTSQSSDKQSNLTMLDGCPKTGDSYTHNENDKTYQEWKTDGAGVDDRMVNKQTTQAKVHEEKPDNVIRLCVLVVHAYESRLNINEKDAGIGYYKVYQTMKRVGNKILVIVGGDDHIGQSKSETVSPWVMHKLSGQFTEEECNGTKGLIFSWNDACTLHHVHKFLHFLGIKEKIENKLKQKSTEVKTTIKIVEINDIINKDQQFFRLLSLCDIFSSDFVHECIPNEEPRISELCRKLKTDINKSGKACIEDDLCEDDAATLSQDGYDVIPQIYPTGICNLAVLVLQADNLPPNFTSVKHGAGFHELHETLKLVSEEQKVLVIIQSDYDKTDVSKFGLEQKYMDGSKGLVISWNKECTFAHVNKVRKMFGLGPKQADEILKESEQNYAEWGRAKLSNITTYMRNSMTKTHKSNKM